MNVIPVAVILVLSFAFIVHFMLHYKGVSELEQHKYLIWYVSVLTVV
jgi:hypothetical protein